MRYDSVLLFSGGIDSYIAYSYLDRVPTPIHFNIGTQYSGIEEKVVTKIIPNIIVDPSLRFLGMYENKDTSEIQMRNFFMILHSVTKYSDKVYIGSMKDDSMGDNKRDTLLKFAEVLSASNGRSIQVISPFWEMTKAEAVEWYYKKYGMEGLINTYSCYSGRDTECMECMACLKKNVALYSVGVLRPFNNKLLLHSVYEKKVNEKTWRKYFKAIGYNYK